MNSHLLSYLVSGSLYLAKTSTRFQGALYFYNLVCKSMEVLIGLRYLHCHWDFAKNPFNVNLCTHNPLWSNENAENFGLQYCNCVLSVTFWNNGLFKMGCWVSMLQWHVICYILHFQRPLHFDWKGVRKQKIVTDLPLLYLCCVYAVSNYCITHIFRICNKKNIYLL